MEWRPTLKPASESGRSNSLPPNSNRPLSRPEQSILPGLRRQSRQGHLHSLKVTLPLAVSDALHAHGNCPAHLLW